MSAALQIARGLPKDKRVVVLLADSVRNYMTKFLSDDWMIQNGFVDQHLAAVQKYASPSLSPFVSLVHCFSLSLSLYLSLFASLVFFSRPFLSVLSFRQEMDKWKGATVRSLALPPATSIHGNLSCKEAVALLNQKYVFRDNIALLFLSHLFSFLRGFDQLPVVDEKGAVIGLVTEGSLLSKMTRK
jgi:hypothetical protein